MKQINLKKCQNNGLNACFLSMAICAGVMLVGLLFSTAVSAAETSTTGIKYYFGLDFSRPHVGGVVPPTSTQPIKCEPAVRCQYKAGTDSDGCPIWKDTEASDCIAGYDSTTKCCVGCDEPENTTCGDVGYVNGCPTAKKVTCTAPKSVCSGTVCVCPSCTVYGAVQNADTCACACPSGMVEKSGSCICEEPTTTYCDSSVSIPYGDNGCPLAKYENCPSGQRCQNNTCVVDTSCKVDGESCLLDSECCGEICRNGICISCASASASGSNCPAMSVSCCGVNARAGMSIGTKCCSVWAKSDDGCSNFDSACNDDDDDDNGGPCAGGGHAILCGDGSTWACPEDCPPMGDPCATANCGACETCVEGECFPITCGDCEECVDGDCVSTCNADEVCENGACVGEGNPYPDPDPDPEPEPEPGPSDPCEGVTCGGCQYCENGNCEDYLPGQKSCACRAAGGEWY